jgi:4-hydroxy-3-polyprenylbenzoate decarboxylase
MKKPKPKNVATLGASRREFLLTGTGLAALAATPGGSSIGNAASGGNKAAPAPFTSMRDYIAALDSYGLVVRIPRIDQDAYEIAALMYRLRDQHGMRGGPTLLIEEVRINGEWVKGPLIVNESGNAHAECIAYGLEPAETSFSETVPYRSYRKARDHLEAMVAKNDGLYPSIAPTQIERSAAPCKEVILTGDAIDLTRFAFIQCNPSDAGRYINTGSVFTRDPKRGVNFGTYRCHLRGPREIAVNSEPGQTGYRHLMAARARGEKTANVSIALTVDPYFWSVSSSKMVYRGGGADELSIAGGLAGRAIEVVRCETNDFLVPANAEMIIEGEVPLDDMRPEGPYGEMVGYQGARKQEVFWMKVTAVTHRREPWIMNNFTGLQVGSLSAAGHAGSLYALRQKIPAIVDLYSDNRAVGMTFVSIRKTEPGQGLAIATQVAKDNFFAKIVVVVDDDLDVTSQEQMLMALGTRWQPFGNTEIFEKLSAMPLDPSTAKTGRGSKIAIDATRQWPEEGGPAEFPALNRSLLEQGAPESFARVDTKFADLIKGWKS